jgi:Uncharacterised nucleotidyltransferase
MMARNDTDTVGDWLMYCADPVGSRSEPPSTSLSPVQADTLVEQADMHGVLPALLRNFLPLQNDATFQSAKADAIARHRSSLTYSLMLRAHGDAVMQAGAGLPMAMVKGPVFARTIYSSPSLRTFTDIDLLIAPEASSNIAEVLEGQGFALGEYDLNPARQEWKWVHRQNPAVMVEVHTNLVHHPELRAAMSIAFQDLAGISETPPALLTVAVTHGALHRYERLRHVIDICQAARNLTSADDERKFETLVNQTGVRFAAIAGLDLTHRMFGEPRCRDIARGLGPAPYSVLARVLIGRSVVTSTMNSNRFYHSWRRQAFRALLKHSKSLE